MPKLVHLPNDILLHLFNSKFYLHELLHLRTICHRFQSLIESKYCIGTRKSLKIFWRLDDLPQYSSNLQSLANGQDYGLRLRDRVDDDLILNRAKFNRSTADWLVRLLPNLSHLLIWFSQSLKFGVTFAEHYPHLAYLISGWPCLVRLSLYGTFDLIPIRKKRQIVQEICTEINDKLHNLIHLDLCVHSMFFHMDPVTRTLENIPVEMNRVWPRLEKLYLGYTNDRYPRKVLRKLGPALIKLNLVDLTIHHIKSVSRALTILPSTKLTHFTTKGTHKFFRQVLGHFTELVSLDLYCIMDSDRIFMPIVDVFPLLTSHRHLTRLSLSIFPLESLQVTVLSNLVQLDTIQQLTIHNRHSFLRSTIDCTALFATLSHAFPSVRVLRITLGKPLVIEAEKHLAQFEQLTQFELTTLYFATIFYPYLLSRKYQRRIEDALGKEEILKRVDTIQDNQQQSVQTWKRIERKDIEIGEKKHIWIKEQTLVWK